MFQVTQEEVELSRSQSAILNSGRGRNIEYLLHAFTAAEMDCAVHCRECSASKLDC
jgi:hypothetical protein